AVAARDRGDLAGDPGYAIRDLVQPQLPGGCKRSRKERSSTLAITRRAAPPQHRPVLAASVRGPRRTAERQLALDRTFEAALGVLPLLLGCSNARQRQIHRTRVG